MKKLLLLLFISISIFAQESKDLTVTYVANSGFMLSSGGKQVIIDALFNRGFERYQVPSNEVKTKIINGESPFSHIDLYLVTHKHGDHFYANDVIDFFNHHDETFLVAPSEAGEQCDKEENLKDRVKNISLGIGSSVDTVVNGFPLKIFRLKHLSDSTGQKVCNYAYLINLNGVKIFHPGDITFEWDKSLLEKFELGKENVDVLFVPYFDLSEVSMKYIKEVIIPKHIIAIHIPPKDFETVSENFLKTYPKGIVLEKSLDSITLKLSAIR